jgi:hypothetical protein
MPVSIELAKQHLSFWSTKLAPFPVRASWPRHLFHTCQLDVAVEIIRAGYVVCRREVPVLLCDVANQGALWNNPAAHSYVRLYFRPRNAFHLKTEGVKAIGDQYRIDPHMSIPIAFAFDFVKTITAQGTYFVPGNFAKSGAGPREDDVNFGKLPFDMIYHDAVPPSEKMNEIQNWRMSEVVVQKRLSLESLSYVICRTIHEERTLRHALAGQILPKIIVEQKGSTFMRKEMFIDEIYWENGFMHLNFHWPKHIKDNYRLVVTCIDNGRKRTGSYQLKPGLYRFADFSASRDAVWYVEIEECMVYRAKIPSTSGLITI